MECHLPDDITQTKCSMFILANVIYVLWVGMEAWVDLSVSYISRWFTSLQTVTHPSSDHLIMTWPGLTLLLLLLLLLLLWLSWRACQVLPIAGNGDGRADAPKRWGVSLGCYYSGTHSGSLDFSIISPIPCCYTAQSLLVVILHHVSKKHPDIFDCNLKTNYQIMIIFGRNIPDTTYHQTTI